MNILLALESMASLSDILSRLLSSSAPPSLSPSLPSLKPDTRSSSCSFPLPRDHLSSCQFSFKADHDDVINRVAYPSLANASLFFFTSGYYNVEVVPKDGESEDQLLNDFRRSVSRAGVLQESRRRRFFESSQEKRTRKTKEAAKKYRKRRPNPKAKPHSTPEIPKNRNACREGEEDDNWGLPPEEVEIPYTSRS